jgi:hypothetical protein
MRLRVALAAASTLAFSLQCVPALADDGDAPQQIAVAAPAADPGVARISVAQGEFDVRRADSDDAYAAVVNAPLGVGDYIATQGDSRGEVEFDFGSSLRVAQNTQLRFTDLRQRSHQLQLAQGTVDLRVFRGLAAHPEIQTPAATIRPAGDGSFRVTVADDGNTEVTARSGRVNVVTSTGTQVVEPGPTLLITGDADDPQIQTIDPVAADGFDAFNDQRDAYVERARDWAYVDAGFVGADDLDQYGAWTNVAGYGEVWQPNDVAAGWAPYQTGRWVWEPYYGWSWVDNAPWGYAPFHYGRWFYANAAWYWAPGIAVAAGPVVYSAPVVYYPRPVFYRPALVAFFSFGGGAAGGVAFGGAFGFGNIGWCALAPFEAFRPWYGRGFAAANVTNVNVNVDVNITRVYRNLRAPGGAVAVNNGNFANGNFEHPTVLDRAQLASATPIRGVLPVVPTAANLAYSAHATARPGSAPPPAPRFARFATQPRIAVAPFAAQQRRVQSAAIASYPEHAAVFQHPDVQRTYDRPGLMTNDDLPDAFRPAAARADSAGSKREDVTTPNGDERHDMPSADRAPADREPISHESENDLPAAHQPAYRAPADRAPEYRAPEYRAPVERAHTAAPKYRAPGGHAPSQLHPKSQPPAKP